MMSPSEGVEKQQLELFLQIYELLEECFRSFLERHDAGRENSTQEIEQGEVTKNLVIVRTRLIRILRCMTGQDDHGPNGGTTWLRN